MFNNLNAWPWLTNTQIISHKTPGSLKVDYIGHDPFAAHELILGLSHALVYVLL